MRELGFTRKKKKKKKRRGEKVREYVRSPQWVNNQDSKTSFRPRRGLGRRRKSYISYSRSWGKEWTPPRGCSENEDSWIGDEGMQKVISARTERARRHHIMWGAE